MNNLKHNIIILILLGCCIGLCIGYFIGYEDKNYQVGEFLKSHNNQLNNYYFIKQNNSVFIVVNSYELKVNIYNIFRYDKDIYLLYKLNESMYFDKELYNIIQHYP